MAHRIEFTPLAFRQLRKIEGEARRRIVDRIEALGIISRPSGVRKLAGEESLYRIRIGDFRVIYEIRDRELVILVVKVGNRRDVYSG